MSFVRYLCCVIVVTVFSLVSASWADVSEELVSLIEKDGGAKKYTLEEVMQIEPPCPNPWLSLTPVGAQVDWSYWMTRSATEAAIKAESMPPANVRIQVKMRNGENTNVIRGFGTAPSETDTIDVDVEQDLPPAMVLMPSSEDEGSIPLATPTGLVSGNAVKVSAVIGDGLFGTAGTGSGDFDFFLIENVQAGQTILIDVDTPIPLGDLDPVAVLYDPLGNVVDFNDDAGGTFDSFLSVEAPVDSDYYVSISGTRLNLQNPLVSSSGPGAGSEGSYDVTIGLDYFDELFLTFRLRKGDIFGASVAALPAELSLTDKTTLERQGSSQDITFAHPTASPLPSGNVALSHAVDRTGDFTLHVLPDKSENYTVSLRVFKGPLLSGVKGDVQTIFIDFDGETIDTGALFLGKPPGEMLSTLSPLVNFLTGWGLTTADENEVIDSILAQVQESVVDDIKMRGREPKFDIQILNSRDHADPFGMPNVSRIIVGGTIPELGIGTLAIAESIDVGNFETKETAVVLLDLLSAPAPDPNSLNSFPLAPGVSIIELIGVGVGNIAAHEAGHYLGNWHTDQFNPLANLMDQGGNLANTVGVGPDGIFGTADDEDVDFGLDVFVPNEGFMGFEDTLNAIAIGDPTPKSNN
jgi:hypothetical protein